MAETDINSLLASLMQQGTDPVLVELRNLLLKRIAAECDIKPSRIQAPLNITEIGGYYNLLAKTTNKAQRQMLSSILGLPMEQSTIESV